MKLGALSVSLGVKDFSASKSFYEKLGFTVFAGNADHNYLIMKNGDIVIGLFQGMFEGNLLTFNPGRDQSANNVDPFDDIREIQSHLLSAGLTLDSQADPASYGPASLILKDPDGNVILIDQHR